MGNDILERDRGIDVGGVRINSDAITAIASTAAMEVRGVHKMGGGITRSIVDFFCGRTYSRGVRVRSREAGLKLTVYVVAEYGASIPKVADEVQDNVKRIVEKTTGLIISEVDVVVESVNTSSGEKPGRIK